VLAKLRENIASSQVLWLLVGELAIVGACVGVGFGVGWSGAAFDGIIPAGVIGAATFAATVRSAESTPVRRARNRGYGAYLIRLDPPPLVWAADTGPYFVNAKCEWTVTEPMGGFQIVKATLRPRGPWSVGWWREPVPGEFVENSTRHDGRISVSFTAEAASSRRKARVTLGLQGVVTLVDGRAKPWRFRVKWPPVTYLDLGER
jgi:hypothetical protein